MKLKFLPLLIGLVAAISSARAQTVVFNDSFGTGSTINTNPTSPAAPLISKTAYQQLSAKTFSPNPPTIASGHLRYGIVSTSSGFNSIEALFTQYPVVLSGMGDYIELTVTFTDQASLMNATNASLFFGLHNSGQIQPIPGGMNSTVATATAGYAQNWQGYVSRIIYSGGTHSIGTRPAQTVAAANNQDVLYNFSGGTNLGTATTPSISAFTAGQQYTEVFRITKTGTAALTVLSTLYQGGDTSGTQLFTETATSSSILTATFDGLGIGYRAVSGASVMDVNSIKVVTNASTTVVPVITQQPASKTVGPGDPVAFNVVASGGGAALSYQWQKDDSSINGATGASYSISAAALSDAGNYTVVVTDAAGSTTSNAATLTVSTSNVPPSILQPPASATVVAGNASNFTATFTGSAPVNAKWQKSSDGGANYVDIAGATTSTSPASYSIGSTQVSDAGSYRLVVTNAFGTATSSAATLAVNYAPVITTQPSSQSIYLGQSATFSVAASANPAATFQWNKNGNAISGATSASYTVASAAMSDAGSYTVTVANSAGSKTSDAAVLTVIDGAAPTIAAPGGGFFPLTLIAGANGTAALPDYTNQAVTTDNAGVTGVTQSPAPGSTLSLGTTTVTLTASDAAGHTASIGFDVMVLPAGSPWPELKVDLSRYTQRSDTAARHFIEWQFDSANPSRTFGNVGVLLRRAGTAGSQLDANWYKFAIDYGALLALDGVYVKDVTSGSGVIEMVLSGLAAGHHTLAAYHNSMTSAASATPSAISVAVNGATQVATVTPSTQVTNDYDIPTSYVEFDVVAGQNVVIAYTALGNGSPASANTPFINGFELDTSDPAKRAKKPAPANDDEHVNGDSGTVTLSWNAAPGAVLHDLYFGTDAAEVAGANHASADFQGDQSGVTAAVTGLDGFATYWWRVDEIDAAGNVTRGDVWRFRIRHLAFPGAEGYGRFARGGRGGRVIEVTNLLDYDTDHGEAVIPGSYRAAIEATGPRTVVFRVSGVIRLKKQCTINAANSYLTVAGQTAPGEGICLSQYSAGMLSANDVIIRDVRMRLGDASQQAMDGMGMGGSNHSIIDHCSISWTMDEATSSRSAKNITFQRNIISEALQHSYHYAAADRTKYETHAFAASISGGISSYHHNLIAHCTDRNWSLAGGFNQGGNYAGQVDIRNNVVYNWQARTTDGGVKQCNFVGNYYKRGPAANSVTWLMKPDAGSASDRQQYYIIGNLMEDTTGAILYEGDNWNAASVIIPSGAAQTDIRVDVPFFPDYVTTHTARDAFRIVLSDVGANLNRDLIDQRVVREVRDGTWNYKGNIASLPNDPRYTNSYAQPPAPNYNGIIDQPGDVLDAAGSPNAPWPAYLGYDVPLDSDHDGMPDFWELAVGTNPNVDDHNADPDGDGYTALEDYLNWLAAPHAITGPGVAVSVDLAPFATGFSSPGFSVNNGIHGTVVLLADGHTAQFTPASGFTGLASFDFTATGNGTSVTRSVGVCVSPQPAAFERRWRGTGSAWDANAANWTNGDVSSAFAPGNVAIFDDTGAASPVITLSGTLQPSSVIVSGVTNYIFTGNGALAGATLVKSGNGTLTLGGSNSFGSVLVQNGTLAITTGVLNAGTIANYGTMRFTGGAALNVSGTFVNNGLLDIISGAQTLPAGFVNNGTLLDRGAVRPSSMARAGTNFTMSITGYAGHGYQLQRADTLNGPWISINSVQMGAGGMLDFSDIGGAIGPQRFYRILISP